MKTAAVICEYNPFHTGHSYMLRELKRLGFERIICFMSGSFVQRGEPAVMDKYIRAEAAVLNGADLVLEMPAEFSTSSAGDFARCGVSMASLTGVCTHLAFGLEKEYDLAKLDLLRKQKADGDLLKEKLKNGASYAEALFGSSFPVGSNAILAMEYLDAIEEAGCSETLRPVTVRRSGDDEQCPEPSGDEFASAASIRKLLLNGDTEKASRYMNCFTGREVLCSPDMLSGLLNDRLLREDDYEVYLDVSREIADRLRKERYFPKSFSERVDETKTRQYSRTRISRALLHIVLNIRRDRTQEMKQKGCCPAFRVLAYRTDSGLLKEIKQYGKLPVYTKNSIYYEAFPDALYYDQIWHNVTGTGTELTRSPVIL